MQPEEDEKITLDMKAFQTLASDTRIGIIKSLDQRRKTLTELSRAFGLSASTVKEHMDKLLEAELVRLVDDGHKWKYYELTRRGTRILHPGTTKIWVMLTLAIAGAFYAAWDLLRWSPAGMTAANSIAEEGSRLLAGAADKAAGAAQSAGGALTAPNACPAAEAAPALPLAGVAALFIFSLLAGAALVALIHSRKTARL